MAGGARGGATLAIVDALGVSLVHDDHLGTPQVMTDGSAAVVWDASYRPFGEASIAGAAANEQRFPGQTADAETGYHDNWFRTYDPSLGRYLQSDPIGIMAGFNTYGYAAGNPIMYADPTGQFIPLVWGIWWMIGTDAALGVGVYVMTVYAYLEIWEKVQARWAAGCDWSELLTTWEMFEIVTAGRLKWVKSLSGLGKGIGGFGRAGRVGKPPAPTRGGGTGRPGGGGGSGGPGGGGSGGPGAGGGGGGSAGGGGSGGGSGSGGGILPDDAPVCRGGTCTADRFANGSGVTVGPDGKLSGVSVNSAPGKSVEELTSTIPNGQVGVTTVGDVRAAGGDVIPDPTRNNPYHCKMCGISADQAEGLFTPTIPNPSKR